MSVISRLYNYNPNELANGDNLELEIDQIIATINNLDYTNLNANAGIRGTQIATGVNGLATANLQDDAVDSTKLKDDAAVDANRAVGINHIKDLAVTLPTIYQTYTHGAIIHLDATESTKLVSTALNGATYTPVGWYATGLMNSYAKVQLEVSGGLIQIRIDNASVHDGQGDQIDIAANIIKILYIKTARS